LLCHKRHGEPLSQKRAANGYFPSRDRDFSAVAAKYSIQLFWFDFDGAWGKVIELYAEIGKKRGMRRRESRIRKRRRRQYYRYFTF
jgi:hypothetical protein